MLRLNYHSWLPLTNERKQRYKHKLSPLYGVLEEGSTWHNKLDNTIRVDVIIDDVDVTNPFNDDRELLITSAWEVWNNEEIEILEDELEYLDDDLAYDLQQDVE